MKIARTIALLLVLVMLASSFTSCFTVIGAVSGDPDALLGGIVLDVLILGLVGGIAALVILLVDAEPADETEFYMANAEYDAFAQYYPVVEKFNSLPEAERIALLEKINSLPEEKRASMFSTVNSLPETEIAASLERLNALSGEELTSAVNKFGTLNETEMDLLEDRLNEKTMYLPGGIAFVQ